MKKEKTNKLPKEIYLAMVANDICRLKKKQEIKYLNPVANQRAKTMANKFGYYPIVADSYTLKPDVNFNK